MTAPDVTPLSTTINSAFGSRYVKTETLSTDQINAKLDSLVKGDALVNLKTSGGLTSNGPLVVTPDSNGFAHMAVKARPNGKWAYSLEGDENYWRVSTFKDDGTWSGKHPLAVNTEYNSGAPSWVFVNTMLNLQNGANLNMNGGRLDFGGGYYLALAKGVDGEDRLALFRNDRILMSWSDGQDRLRSYPEPGNSKNFTFLSKDNSIGRYNIANGDKKLWNS